MLGPEPARDRRRALPRRGADQPGVRIRTHRRNSHVAGQPHRQLARFRAGSGNEQGEKGEYDAGHRGGNTSGRRSERPYTRIVDVFTVVSGGLIAFFVIATILLGVFSKRSALDILDWKPTRSPEIEAANEIDDVEQMIAAQNDIRRRLGKPERTLDEIQSEWRGS